MRSFRARDWCIWTKCTICISVNPPLLRAVCNPHIIRIIRIHICIMTRNCRSAINNLCNPVYQLSTCDFIIGAERPSFLHLIGTDSLQSAHSWRIPIWRFDILKAGLHLAGVLIVNQAIQNCRCFCTCNGSLGCNRTIAVSLQKCFLGGRIKRIHLRLHWYSRLLCDRLRCLRLLNGRLLYGLLGLGRLLRLCWLRCNRRCRSCRLSGACRYRYRACNPCYEQDYFPSILAQSIGTSAKAYLSHIGLEGFALRPNPQGDALNGISRLRYDTKAHLTALRHICPARRYRHTNISIGQNGILRQDAARIFRQLNASLYRFCLDLHALTDVANRQHTTSI